MVAEVKGNQSYTGFTEASPSDPVTGNTDSKENDKQPASASMVALSLLPGVDPAAIMGRPDLRPYGYFLGAPQQQPQALAAAPRQQGQTNKAADKNKPSGGMQITAGEPKEKEDESETSGQQASQPTNPTPTAAPAAQPAPQPEPLNPFNVGVEGVTEEGIGLSHDSSKPVQWS